MAKRRPVVGYQTSEMPDRVVHADCAHLSQQEEGTPLRVGDYCLEEYCDNCALSFTTTPTSFPAARFYFDGGTKVIGYDTGKEWNGAACPLLPEESLITLLNDRENFATWYRGDADDDGAIFAVVVGTDPSEPSKIDRVADAISPKGETLYDLSKGGWSFLKAPIPSKKSKKAAE